LELSDADDVVAIRDWAEFADGREELEPERLKVGLDDAGAEPEDEWAE
jgi:hypothetical protein